MKPPGLYNRKFGSFKWASSCQTNPIHFVDTKHLISLNYDINPRRHGQPMTSLALSPRHKEVARFPSLPGHGVAPAAIVLQTHGMLAVDGVDLALGRLRKSTVRDGPEQAMCFAERHVSEVGQFHMGDHGIWTP